MSEKDSNDNIMEKSKRLTHLLWGGMAILTMALIVVTYTSIVINPPRFENYPYRVFNSNDANQSSNIDGEYRKKEDDSEKSGGEPTKKIMSEPPSKNDHFVQYIAYHTYEKIISWVGIIGGIFFIVGGISMSILGFEIWNIRKSLEKTLEKARSEQDKIEAQLKSNSKKFQEVSDDTTRKIDYLEEQSKEIEAIRKNALQDIEDLKKLVSMKQSDGDERTNFTEGFVKFGDISEDGRVVNTLWTTINSQVEINRLPEMHSRLKANTCVFLRSDLPELIKNDVKLASPKRIIEKKSVVEVLDSFTFQINPKNVRIWLRVKLIVPEC
ncbi:hypothetical protein PTW35_22225 (plasmid) [Photobacterium sp. DA100]|uniref:hypothetical protein n=1 Tax=Photobacterium sp. DA100 TaxID=3027472 RepID=UPI00247A3C9A|nr:hypothetical protein [Photobacterium sp. DA100]WEM45793.1 hypothetical protein PTW35_22225 [Photobacterium sp. DA100]